MAKLYLSLLLTCLAVIIPTLVHANMKEESSYWEKQLPVLSDSYWKEKAEIAAKANEEAYTPDPYAVSGNLTSTESEWKNWQWRSINDVYMNGAFFRQGGSELTNRPFSKKDMITAKPGAYVGRLTRYSGSLKCIVGKPC